MAVVDVRDTTIRISTNLEGRINIPENQVQSVQDIVSWLSLLNIYEAGDNPSPNNYDITCRYLDSVATKIRKRATADENAVVFNVPERMQLLRVNLRLPMYAICPTISVVPEYEKLQE